MKKGFSLAFLVMFLIILLHVDVSIAIQWKTDASVEGYLIPNQWEEEEFSLDSHFGRLLYDVSQSVTGKSRNRGQPASNCPPGQNYRSCLPDPNTGGPRQKCNEYTRSRC